MARGTLTPINVPSKWSVTPATLTFTTGDSANGHQFQSTGREALIVFNSGGSAYTFTVTSVADDKGRTGNISAVSVAAGAYAICQMFPQEGWQQTDGYIYVDVSNNAVKLAVVKFP